MIIEIMPTLKIAYTIADTPLGYLIVAATEKGICCVRFGESKKKLEAEFEQEFEGAEFVQGGRDFKKWSQALIDYLSGQKPWPLLPYDLQATAFQKLVWEWLRQVPTGETYSYSEAAEAIGSPNAARAVARACATNLVALVIPCHRIVPKSGDVGGYYWGSERKRKLLELEKARK